MYNPTVSVVINTHNRGPHLKRLLDALSRQTYDRFEVIVVNGPSTDNTEDVLKQYQSAIRTDKCPIVNLCVSRNIGVRDAAGEIIAFIDDDAVPQDKKWIENAVHYFQNEKVGFVGGVVLRLGGNTEFRYGYFDIWGQNSTINDRPIIYDDPNGEKFSRGSGGNIFFRTKSLIETGGFDEYYAYFLDETDLCMRIIKKDILVNTEKIWQLSMKLQEARLENQNIIGIGMLSRNLRVILFSRLLSKVENLLRSV